MALTLTLGLNVAPVRTILSLSPGSMSFLSPEVTSMLLKSSLDHEGYDAKSRNWD